MLEKHPKNNLKLLLAYASFQSEVMINPWRANELLVQAAKLEEEESRGDADGVGQGGVNDKVDCVIVISSTGVMKIANANMHKLLGYKKDELVGKNVSAIMPKPYSQQHNGYLRRYAAKQKASILDVRQRLEALTKKARGLNRIRSASNPHLIRICCAPDPHLVPSGPLGSL